MLSDLLLKIGQFFLSSSQINKIAINLLVKAGPNRPHAWSTRFDDYICWSGLTDKTFFARLLPARPLSGPDALGTSHPPIADVVKLFGAAPGQQRTCPKSTCLFPAFAQYLTDGFLRTQVFNTPPGPRTQPGEPDPRRTTSNHEIDLSALYGRTEAQTKVLRTGNGGKLKSQIIQGEEFPPFLYGDDGNPKSEFCGADGLLVLDEPLGVEIDTRGRHTLFAVGGDRANASVQVATINTLFLREHNRLADELSKRNKGWDDERLFQTARNILIVKFIRIVVNEYINHISSAPFRFEADPSVCWGSKWNRPNWMTIEFTLLYRWHSLVPETLTWNGKQISPALLLLDNELLISGGLANAMEQISANPAARMGLGNFAHFFLRAGPNGDDPVASVEGRGIQQWRANHLQSYNAYRRAMGLSPARGFADVVGTSKDPVEQQRRNTLAAGLQRLYGVVDNLEFYVGLFAEPCLPNSPIPELVLAMVAMDAFSQALPNPLLSEHVWGDDGNRAMAFTPFGVDEIAKTNTLHDILVLNADKLGGRFVGMTQQGWTRQ